MEFSRQEYWSGLLFPSPGDLPNLGFGPTFPALAGGFSTAEPPGKPSPSLRAAKSLNLKHVHQIGFPGSTVVKNPLASAGSQETQVRSLGGEDPVE